MCLLFYFDKLLSINPWSNIQYFPVWFWLVQVRFGKKEVKPIFSDKTGKQHSVQFSRLTDFYFGAGIGFGIRD
jgi:hypothetical protein